MGREQLIMREIEKNKNFNKRRKYNKRKINDRDAFFRRYCLISAQKRILNNHITMEIKDFC